MVSLPGGEESEARIRARFYRWENLACFRYTLLDSRYFYTMKKKVLAADYLEIN